MDWSSFNNRAQHLDALNHFQEIDYVHCNESVQNHPG